MDDDTLFAAVEFATRAHRGQFRKGTRVPYILHPLRVMRILIQADAEADVALAGLLHDLLEDTPTTVDEIAARFGDRVAAIVVGASESDRSAAWEDRKRATVLGLRVAEPPVLLVACADKLDNLASMRSGERRAGPAFWDRFHRPKDVQGWYYRGVSRAIARRASERPLTGLAERLEADVAVLFGADGPSADAD